MKIRSASSIPYPKSFPPKSYFVEPDAMETAKGLALKELVETDAGETAVDAFLKLHPALLAACMNFTQFGHHGTWVISQQHIRPPSLPDIKGLKPDYLVGGRNSNGYEWYVVELKGPSDRLFTRNGGSVALSSTANKGLCQLLQYIDYCSSAQAYLRDTLKLKEFREPQGILILGRDREFEDAGDLQDLKGALNRATAGSIQIRTFDALLRSHGLSWINEARSEDA